MRGKCAWESQNMSRHRKMKILGGKGQTGEKNCSFTFGTGSV